tara:strand:- start:1876 stop:2151 length:276 start_codon:yes stop_codon:yes gene_type:complete
LRCPSPINNFENTFSRIFLTSKSIVKAKKSMNSGVMMQIFNTPFYSFIDSFTIIRDSCFLNAVSIIRKQLMLIKTTNSFGGNYGSNFEQLA